MKPKFSGPYPVLDTRGKIPLRYLPSEYGADYNQNDPTQPDYIKGRPFYESETVIIDEKLLDYQAEGIGVGAVNIPFPDVNVGDTFKVEMTYYGNVCSTTLTMVENAFDNITGALWRIGIPIDAEVYIMSGKLTIVCGEGIPWADDTIKVMSNIVVPMDEKFLPDTVKDSLAKIEGSTVTRYGVKFGGSANSGATVQRLYDAFGLVANVGTDTEAATNDFDNIYPWSERKRACGYFDDNGNFVVNAYEGEPSYATDGSNGEVWVETPLFYYLHTYNDDGSEEIVISAHPIGGYKPSPIHINADGSLRQKAYTAAYPMALVDDKPTSRSGVYTPIMSLNSGMTNARKLGDKYTTTTAAEQYVKCLLMWVEFATRDIQTKMKGCSALSYSENHKATVAEDVTNRIIISSSHAAAYVIGQGIVIGTTLGNTSVANNRTVTAIDAYDDSNSAITFDGDPVNIAVGNVVSATAWKTGSCDNVLSSSGSPVSNTNGKYTCIYRGEETPFGNAYEWISDVLFKREGSGTTEDPYTYDIYFLPDATKYSDGSITDDYVKVNYQLPTADGYAKTLGYDERFPFLRIPSAVGASTTTYYADYYQYPRGALCAASVGGSWYSGANCGPCFWHCHVAPSHTVVYRRARLSYRR